MSSSRGIVKVPIAGNESLVFSIPELRRLDGHRSRLHPPLLSQLRVEAGAFNQPASQRNFALAFIGRKQTSFSVDAGLSALSFNRSLSADREYTIYEVRDLRGNR
ncbi:hypothetical protein CRENBAI_001758 [Crenichthys baileyi]|uniref:Uncharacterized protein n=1 Tax=Crenichthys baileyi TaxID=28760 RepID=A0AAV9R3Q4_9TELE